MEPTTPEKPTLGEIGYLTALKSLGYVPDGDLVPFATLRDSDREAWEKAAEAIVVEYDTRLFQKAEDEAVAAGLDPQPLPGIMPPPRDL